MIITVHSTYQCLNSYTAVNVHEDLFKILGELYDEIDLHTKVLDHIKKNRKYYGIVAVKYLWSKTVGLSNLIS